MDVKSMKTTTLVDFNPKAHVCPHCLGLVDREIKVDVDEIRCHQHGLTMPDYEIERLNWPTPIANDRGKQVGLEWIPKYFYWGECKVDPALIVDVFGLERGRRYVYSNKFGRLLLVIDGMIKEDSEWFYVVKDPRNGHKYKIHSGNWVVSAPMRRK